MAGSKGQFASALMSGILEGMQQGRAMKRQRGFEDEDRDYLRQTRDYANRAKKPAELIQRGFQREEDQQNFMDTTPVGSLDRATLNTLPLSKFGLAAPAAMQRAAVLRSPDDELIALLNQVDKDNATYTGALARNRAGEDYIKLATGNETIAMQNQATRNDVDMRNLVREWELAVDPVYQSTLLNTAKGNATNAYGQTQVVGNGIRRALNPGNVENEDEAYRLAQLAKYLQAKVTNNGLQTELLPEVQGNVREARIITSGNTVNAAKLLSDAQRVQGLSLEDVDPSLKGVSQKWGNPRVGSLQTIRGAQEGMATVGDNAAEAGAAKTPDQWVLEMTGQAPISLDRYNTIVNYLRKPGALQQLGWEKGNSLTKAITMLKGLNQEYNEQVKDDRTLDIREMNATDGGGSGTPKTPQPRLETPGQRNVRLRYALDSFKASGDIDKKGNIITTDPEKIQRIKEVRAALQGVTVKDDPLPTPGKAWPKAGGIDIQRQFTELGKFGQPGHGYMGELIPRMLGVLKQLRAAGYTQAEAYTEMLPGIEPMLEKIKAEKAAKKRK